MRIPLDQAALGPIPAFHAHCGSASFHLINSGRAEFRAQGWQGPSGRVEHPHAALAIDQDGHILQAAVAVDCDIQDVIGLLQKSSHEKLIGIGRSFFGEILRVDARILSIGRHLRKIPTSRSPTLPAGVRDAYWLGAARLKSYSGRISSASA